MCEKPVSLAIKSVTSVSACRMKSSTFPVSRHPNCMTPATAIRLQINVQTEDRGRRENSWRGKEISVNRKQVTVSVVERRRGRGRGGRKDAAEVKNIERAASENKDESSMWRIKATVSQQDSWGFSEGQDRLNAVCRRNTNSLPFVTQTQK